MDRDGRCHESACSAAEDEIPDPLYQALVYKMLSERVLSSCSERLFKFG